MEFRRTVIRFGRLSVHVTAHGELSSIRHWPAQTMATRNNAARIFVIPISGTNLKRTSSPGTYQFATKTSPGRSRRLFLGGPETGFAEFWDESAFDSTAFPPSRLPARSIENQIVLRSKSAGFQSSYSRTAKWFPTNELSGGERGIRTRGTVFEMALAARIRRFYRIRFIDPGADLVPQRPQIKSRNEPRATRGVWLWRC